MLNYKKTAISYSNVWRFQVEVLMMEANNISREATVHVSYIWNLKHYLPRDWSSFSCPETNEDKFEDKQLNLNFFPKLQYLDTNKDWKKSKTAWPRWAYNGQWVTGFIT